VVSIGYVLIAYDHFSVPIALSGVKILVDAKVIFATPRMYTSFRSLRASSTSLIGMCAGLTICVSGMNGRVNETPQRRSGVVLSHGMFCVGCILLCFNMSLEILGNGND
jgi:hypothetical protein